MPQLSDHHEHGGHPPRRARRPAGRRDDRGRGGRAQGQGISPADRGGTAGRGRVATGTRRPVRGDSVRVAGGAVTACRIARVSCAEIWLRSVGEAVHEAAVVLPRFVRSDRSEIAARIRGLAGGLARGDHCEPCVGERPVSRLLKRDLFLAQQRGKTWAHLCSFCTSHRVGLYRSQPVVGFLRQFSRRVRLGGPFCCTWN